MGSPNDLIYIQTTYPTCKWTCTRDRLQDTTTPDFKKFFTNQGIEYIGTDIEESSPVDPLKPGNRTS
jgi:hypothetical protein